MNKVMKKYRYKIIALIIVLIGGVYGYLTQTENTAPKQEGTMRVHFIDVGNGDSTFIEFPDGKTMLIDAGEVTEGGKVLSYIQGLGTDKIDFLVGTHPHSDHIGGLETIVRNLEIGGVYMPRVSHDTKTFEDLLLAIREKGMKVKTVYSGMDFYEENGVLVEVLSPIYNEYDNLNNYSIVLRISYNDTSFLFTGDAENDVLEEMGVGVPADVLKVPHHGSYTSRSELFLSRVDPDYAVISSGEDNQYGHPHREVLELLEDYNIGVYRTDKDGTVVIESDGKKIKVAESGD